MDFRKIKLENERSEHVTKRLNRLSTWGFFKVLYRDNIFRLFGFSLLMIAFMAPILFMLVGGTYKVNTLQQSLPLLNEIGFATGSWNGVTDSYVEGVKAINDTTVLYTCLVALACSVIFCGGFAVIRDAFWTGKLSTVGVFRSMWLGLKSSFLYALVGAALISATVGGLYFFYTWASSTMALWLAIVLLVLLCIVALFFVTYVLIVMSVAVTYKQSVAQTLDDSWRLLWLNVLPNIIHVIIALLPIALYFILGGLFQQLLFILMFMFGGMYFPLVWQTHMMKTFALFHPVEARKKGKGGNTTKAAAPVTVVADKSSDIDEDEQTAVVDVEQSTEADESAVADDEGDDVVIEDKKD